MHPHAHKQTQTHTRSHQVKRAELTPSPSLRLAVLTKWAPLLKPVGILQMAIKMHEACWNRGEEPLKQEKQNLREKKKKIRWSVCRQADTPRTEERASDESSASTAAGVHFQELRMCILLSTLSTLDKSSRCAAQAAIWLSRVMFCRCLNII